MSEFCTELRNLVLDLLLVLVEFFLLATALLPFGLLLESERVVFVRPLLGLSKHGGHNAAWLALKLASVLRTTLRLEIVGLTSLRLRMVSFLTSLCELLRRVLLEVVYRHEVRALHLGRFRAVHLIRGRW